ncbi:MAG: type I pullulanase [Acholeplasmatales bacterium]|nr:type I pullulanase [Acholeplasmatales bacterium]
MKEKLMCYIDSYEIITVLADKSISVANKSFYLLDGDIKIRLEILDHYDEYEFHKYILKFIPMIELCKDYYIIDDMGNKGLLRSGSIIRTEEFDENFRYDGPLGFEYSKECTIFRVWSPVAKEIRVELINEKVFLPMTYTDRGVWELRVNKDIEGYGYLFHVRVFDYFEVSLDPYGIASSANHKYNYVIDKNKLYKMKNKKPTFLGSYTEAIIYEANINDFTCDLKDDNKGLYLGMLENNPTKKGPTGIEYIKSLGITHLQLLPTFDFGGVDDIKKTSKYNWGYNPVQYFVPSGWYSKHPNDPYSRINELKELIDCINGEGIRVNMDVVFNHVYDVNECEKIVPGYFFRIELNGRLSNASGCGNVIATERYMSSRFVKDVLKYYAKEFNVSGFRFDLMGLLDIDTLNELNKELRAIDNTIMLYGEGWNMMNPLPDEKRPHMFNHAKLPNYAFFNDRFRDFIRGSQWNKCAGYSFDNNRSIFDLNHLMTGSCQDYFKFNEPSQSINYVECHDNYTFYDYGKYELNCEDKVIFDAARIAMSLTILSQGIPFIHAGQEFFRTKQGDENSYKSKPSINKIDYRRRDRYINNVNTLRDLISLRKEYREFRLNTRHKVNSQAHVLEGMLRPQATCLLLEGTNYQLFVVVKNDYENDHIELEDTTMIFDGFKRCNLKRLNFHLTKPGVYVLRKEKKNANNWKDIWY